MKSKDWVQATVDADVRMKTTNGHLYITILKTRCQYCGKSPNVKTKCPGWFQTYIVRLREILTEKKVIKD